MSHAARGRATARKDGQTMDGQQFDAMSRAMARVLVRRTSLKALVGVAMAGIATRMTGNEAAACTDFGLPCTTSAECCDSDRYHCISGHPTSVCGVCKGEGESCATDQECCSEKCDFGLVFSNCAGKKKVKCEGNGCKKKGKKGKKRKRNGGQNPGCTSHADCSYFEKCSPDGKCVPIECNFDSDCPPGQYCLDNFTCDS